MEDAAIRCLLIGRANAPELTQEVIDHEDVADKFLREASDFDPVLALQWTLQVFDEQIICRELGTLFVSLRALSLHPYFLQPHNGTRYDGARK
jgi:hypothetical protein